MLDQKRITEIDLLCHEIVGDVFSFMCNPKYRGDIPWDRFPEKMAASCRTSVLRCLDIPQKMHEAAQDHAEERARYLARLWVMNSTT